MEINELLTEKVGGGLSAGRAVAILFSIVFAFRLVVFTLMGLALGWPDAILGVFCLLAVPLHRLFTGTRAHELAMALINRLGMGSPGTNAATDTVKSVLEKLPGLDNRRIDDERG